MGRDGAYTATPQDIALHSYDTEVGTGGASRRFVAGLDAQRPDIERARFSSQATATDDWDHHAPLEADAATVEQRRRVTHAEHAAPGYATGPKATSRELKNATTLQEELSLLRKEQVEPGQVDLLLVDLHLGEIGVHGEVGGQVLGHAELHIESDVTVQIVPYGRPGRHVGRDAPDGVGLDFEMPTAFRRLQPDERARSGDAEHSPASAEAGGRDRNLGQIRPLILSEHGASQLDPPHLLSGRSVAE